jgi:hypothetical protein
LPACEKLNQSFDYLDKEHQMAQATPEFGARRARRNPTRWSRLEAQAPRRTVGVDPALRDFYAEDPTRADSRELDLGLRWRGLDESTYRAAWIAGTGELYAVRHGSPSETSRVSVLARLGPEGLARALDGWREIVDSDEPGTYEWLRARARTAK